MRFQKVLIAIDFGGPSVRAAQWVHRHFASSAPLVLAHIVDVPKPPAFLSARVTAYEELVETSRTGAVQRLQDVAAQLEGAQVETVVRIGEPSGALAAIAAETGADLIVLGHHGRRRGVWSLFGSTAERVLNESPVPVLLAAGLPDGPPRTILAPIASAGIADAILDAADRLARRWDARIIALHVFDPRMYGRVQLVSAPREGDAGGEVRLAAEQWLVERVAAAGIDATRTTTQICLGVPGFEVLSAATRFGADFIVIGSREGRLRRALLGSVARDVLRGAVCPVLVLRDDGTVAS